jgi:hypothetical protein
MERIMKRITVILLVLFHAAGCIKEDTSDCPPPYNVFLPFTLPGEELLDRVSSVEVLLFDSTGHYLRAERVERAALEAWQGARLRLPPGRYRACCWANRSEHTRYDALELAGEGTLRHAAITGGRAGDADPLYRSPGIAAATRAPLAGNERVVDGLLTLEVPPDGIIEVPAPFYPSHRVIETLVVGFDGGHSLPEVEITGLPSGLSLCTGHRAGATVNIPASVSSLKSTTPAPDEEGGLATFTTFLFPLDDPGITIRVINPPSGEEVFSVSLASLVDPAIPATTVTIRIKIVFRDGTVTVTLLGWEDRPIDPK